MGAVEIAQAPGLTGIGLIVGKKSEFEIGESSRTAQAIEVLRPGITPKELEPVRKSPGQAGLE